MTSLVRHSAQSVALRHAAAGLLAAFSTIAAAQESPKTFAMHEVPIPVAAIQFEDDQGQSRSLADFHGKVIVLNIWATWCVPCRKEMPTLDRLQAALSGTDFEVVALSIDRNGIDVVRKFFADVGIHNLKMYLDSSGQALPKLGVLGLPTTLLIDRNGQEIGRLIGPAVWDTREKIAFIKCVISRGSDQTQVPMPSCAEQGVDLPASGTPMNGQP